MGVLEGALEVRSFSLVHGKPVETVGWELGSEKFEEIRRHMKCFVLLMEDSGEILLTSRYGEYPIIYKILYISNSGGCLGFLNHQPYVQELFFFTP